jgi:hypothetical protein
MHDIMHVKVLNGGKNGSMWRVSRIPWVIAIHHVPHAGDSIHLRELASLAYSIKELSACRELEREIVFVPRLKPFIKLDLHSISDGHAESRSRTRLDSRRWGDPSLSRPPSHPTRRSHFP